MAEATLEDPKQILRAQERQARDKAMEEMKADASITMNVSTVCKTSPIPNH